MAEYIERGALKAKLALFCSENCSKCTDIDCGKCFLTNIINTSIAADVAPVVHGKWREVDGEDVGSEWYCTACRNRRTFLYDMSLDDMKECYLYCPNCGAKMDGGNNNG
ncbi:MAG: hypothetical protein ACI4XJ_02715 [Eubacteriales bacterium]